MRKIVISQLDDGMIFQASEGDLISIRLSETPATGYLWEVKECDDQILKIQDQNYSVSSDSGVGGGGLRTISFVAKSPGMTKVQLNLRRKWEPDPINTFCVTININ